MGFIKYWDEKVKKLNMWDIGVLKVYVLLIGMVIGAYVSGFVIQYLTAFIVVIVLLMIILLSKIFKK